VDFETKATSKGLLWGEDEFTFGEGSITVIKDYSLYLLPAFGKWKEEVDPKDSLGNVVKGRYASIMCEERSTLFPYSVGIRAYVKSKETGEEGVYNEWWHDKKYGLSPKWMKEQNVLYHPHVNLEGMGIAGEVRLRPIYGIGGMVFEGAPDFVCDDVGMHFKFNKKELTIDPKMDAETEVTMTTNWERVADRTYYNVHLGFDTDMDGVNLYDLVQKQFSTQYTTLCEKKGTDATTGDSEASLRIVNKMPNRDPFRPITSKLEALWMYDGVGDLSYWKEGGALANLTITQEPYTNPRVIHFGAYKNNNSNSTPHYVQLMAWEDVVDLPFNGGNISHTWNKQHDDLGSHSTYQYTATITPDEEKGWGYYTISGSYTCQGEDYGKNKDDEIVLIRTKSESGTFSGPIKYDLDTMGGNNPQSGIWILTSEFSGIEMHGNSSYTDYWTDENGDSQSKTYSGSYDCSGAIIVRMTY
jgi:hypothetical protein